MERAYPTLYAIPFGARTILGATAAIEEPHDHALPEGCMVVLGLCRPRRHARL